MHFFCIIKKHTYVVTGRFKLVNGIESGLEVTKETVLKEVTFGVEVLPFFFSALFLGIADK